MALGIDYPDRIKHVYHVLEESKSFPPYVAKRCGMLRAEVLLDRVPVYADEHNARRTLLELSGLKANGAAKGIVQLLNIAYSAGALDYSSLAHPFTHVEQIPPKPERNSFTHVVDFDGLAQRIKESSPYIIEEGKIIYNNETLVGHMPGVDLTALSPLLNQAYQNGAQMMHLLDKSKAIEVPEPETGLSI